MYHKESYRKHGEWYNKHFPTEESKAKHIQKIKSTDENNVSNWLQNIFFSCLKPLTKSPNQRWLTVGDAYGLDAYHILSHKDQEAHASDLNSDFLRIAKQEGVITDYSSENAEMLSFEDETFDYVLCKESYHHFPRPYAALYEMIRVSKKGIVIIEPQDPISKMPFLLFMTNLFTVIHSGLANKFWKNRFSYEPVGNFVYKVSEREFEKFAAALNCPLIAFKGINPNFYYPGAENTKAKLSDSKFFKIKLKRGILDFLVKMKFIPSQVLCTVVFKSTPEASTLKDLKISGYKIVHIPPNPYLG
ncbi:MAG: methyltransferase domain-containing protein [Daejeonella sp.]